MSRQIGRHALSLVAGESSPNEGERVAAVHLRAGRTSRGSSVATGQECKATRFLIAAIASQDFACLSVCGDPLAHQADRRGAVVRSAELFENGWRSRPVSGRELFE
jgi:hypothetical protein